MACGLAWGLVKNLVYVVFYAIEAIFSNADVFLDEFALTGLLGMNTHRA